MHLHAGDVGHGINGQAQGRPEPRAEQDNRGQQDDRALPQGEFEDAVDHGWRAAGAVGVRRAVSGRAADDGEVQGVAERLGFGFKNGLQGLQIAGLQFEVGGQRDGSEAVVAVAQICGVAEFGAGVRPPPAQIFDAGTVSQGRGDDIAVQVALGHVQGGLRLVPAGAGDINFALILLPDGQGQLNRHADDLLAIPGPGLGKEGRDFDFAPGIILRQGDLKALLFQFQAALLQQVIFLLCGAH